MKFYTEQGELERTWVEQYCLGDWSRCVRYRMEERGETHPDWMLPDGTMDERLRE
jgi:DNA polymerase